MADVLPMRTPGLGLRAEIDEAHERLDAEASSSPPEGNGVPAPAVDLRVAGTAPLTLFDLGGKKPTTATLALTGGSLELADGQAYRKGDRVYVEGVAVIRSVSQKDKVDSKTGVVLECIQTHVAVIEDLVVQPATEDNAA